MSIAELFLVCALALPAQAPLHPFTDESKFFIFLKRYSDGQIVVIKKPWDAIGVIKTIAHMRGIVLLESHFGELRGFFNTDGWERVPFKYGPYQIYQRSS